MWDEFRSRKPEKEKLVGRRWEQWLATTVEDSAAVQHVPPDVKEAAVIE
jgi:hypothetical protein